MEHKYQRPDEGHECKMGAYGTCCQNVKGCISSHGKLFITTNDGHYLHVVSKKWSPLSSTITCYYVEVDEPQGAFLISPETLRDLTSHVREQRAYMRRICEIVG